MTTTDTMNGTKDDTKTTDTKTPTRGESATRHLYKRALEEDRKEDADLIATIAKLLMPAIKLTAGPPVAEPKTDSKKATVSASVDGTEVDLTDMEDEDAADYAAYTRELDGTARLRRHVEQMERDDEEMREIRMHDGG